MANLYASLFTYKAKPERSPLEEFTSGALTDLLSRMTSSELERFLSVFRFPDGTKPIADVGNLGSLSWDAEHSVWSKTSQWGRADIIALEGSTPSIIIENKIDASVSDTQIDLYRSALERASSTHKLLLFLTHTTEPPECFLKGNSNSTVAHGCCRWYDVFTFLSEMSSSPTSAPELQILCKEFCSFLREKELHMEVMHVSDIAVARLYLEASSRIDQTTRTVFDPIIGEVWRWRQGYRGDYFDGSPGFHAYWARLDLSETPHNT